MLPKDDDTNDGWLIYHDNLQTIYNLAFKSTMLMSRQPDDPAIQITVG